MPASTTAMNSYRSVSRWGTSGSTAPWVSARTSAQPRSGRRRSWRYRQRPVRLERLFLRQHLAHRRRLGCEGCRALGEALAPAARRPEVDVDEPGACVEAEALKADRACRRLEGLRIVVHHGDVGGNALEMLGDPGAADRAVVLGAAVGGADDQRLAETRAHLQLFRARLRSGAGLPVPRQAISAGENFGQRQAAAGTSISVPTRSCRPLTSTISTRSALGAERNTAAGAGSSAIITGVNLGPLATSAMSQQRSRAPVLACRCRDHPPRLETGLHNPQLLRVAPMATPILLDDLEPRNLRSVPVTAHKDR